MSLSDAVDADTVCCVDECFELVRIHDRTDAGRVPCPDHEDDGEDGEDGHDLLCRCARCLRELYGDITDGDDFGFLHAPVVLRRGPTETNRTTSRGKR